MILGMAKSRPVGRPRKPNAEKNEMLVQVLLDTETGNAVQEYHRREGFASRSEAVRRLLRRALKAEGLL